MQKNEVPLPPLTDVSFTDNYTENPVFTKEMKAEYTILIPTMLPLHFQLLCEVFRRHGYNTVVLDNAGRSNVDEGVKYVHNDACYPAICVVGQFIDALKSGCYDVDKTALMIMQTGGGCRASNYISMLRKGLQRAGLGQVPVISLNYTGLEKQPGFKFSGALMLDFIYAIVAGDMLMYLRNQCRSREMTKGETQALTESWLMYLEKKIRDGSLKNGFDADMKRMAGDFSLIKLSDPVVRVGIVGEIYVKYSPLGNNELERFLCEEGAETVVPGLLDFCYYCAYNNILDEELYGMNRLKKPLWSLVCSLIRRKKRRMNGWLKEAGFMSLSSYEELVENAEKAGCVGMGMKMGEGWLLTAEMIELCNAGVTNIVCTQPFGCLPNHIVGKGMVNPVKELFPGANIVSIDYDPSASSVNQENRLKLMLANAGKINA